MKARDHTRRMVAWWAAAGVDRVDLAASARQGMIQHLGITLGDRYLGWAGALNVRRADVYIRPARGRAWPLILLDDVEPRRALAIATKYGALVVQTSLQGGCHVWLRCAERLDETQRRNAQRRLAALCHADPAATSGEHLGRLAGYRNWKRGGCWVNVIAATQSPPWEVKLDEAIQPAPRRVGQSTRSDASPSAQEWCWVCQLLERGLAPELAYVRLVESARPRRGRDAERYARRTVDQALRHTRGNE